MKPHIQKLPLSEQSSFVADKFLTPYFETGWHYHPEYELVLMIKGNGKRFVGNHVSDYCEGELDFLGPNLPHWYRKEKQDEEGGSIVIHFKEEFIGKGFLQIPEMQKIGLLFAKAKMGLHFSGNTRTAAAQKMEEMLSLSGIDRLICLLALLKILSDSPEYALLSSPEAVSQSEKESDRLQKVFSYVLDHLQEDIHVNDVAKIAVMSQSGFCRYFKNRTKKNFSHFVNEIRVSHACKQLMKDDFSVSYVCAESGFNNMANFNKQFKKIVKQTPYQFKKMHKL
ncbi:MAG TPA: AraC family transcriptional regulator [Chitinophagaceae bacterium]|nr:AraC family transcriptional regulator [Chitinophagaceae bacterium]